MSLESFTQLSFPRAAGQTWVAPLLRVLFDTVTQTIQDIIGNYPHCT